MRVISLEAGEVPEKDLIERTVLFDPQIVSTVAEIIQTVREQGDQALRDYTQKLDGVKNSVLTVPAAEIHAANHLHRLQNRTPRG